MSGEEYSESGSSYSSEDEDGVLLTDQVEKKLLTVVAQLRNKDPQIYQIDQPVFNDEDFQGHNTNNNQSDNAGRKKKKYTYGDMLMNVPADQSSDEENEELSSSHENDAKKIKDKLKSKLKSKPKNREDVDSDDEMFKIKKKAVKQSKNDEKQKLQDLVEGMDENNTKLLTEFWNKPQKMDETDLFLKKYILDKKWVTSKYIKEEELFNNKEQAMVDEEDEVRSVEMDEYEAKYNFRYEEPGADKIVQFPRTIPESMRIKPETRKDKRRKALEKKKEEANKMREEMEEKKKAKKEQILQKINELQNGENHESQMEAENSQQFEHDWFFCDDCAKAFEEDQVHYVCDECGEYMLCQECFDLIIHKHDMRRDVIPKGFGPPASSVAERSLKKLKSCRNCRKKLPSYLKHFSYTDKTYTVNILCEKCYDDSNLEIKKKFRQMEPEQHNFEELLEQNPEKVKEITCQKDIEDLVDQYMKYDYEDVIGGGLKTKFKYVKVKPESYGLSDDQILYGDDRELNKYVSIKKLAAYEDEQMKLRNNLYKRKIGGIDKSAKDNKKLLSKVSTKKVRLIQKMKSRSELIKKRRENLRRKLKMVNLSNPEKQREHFIPKSRLESYGLTE